MRRTLLALLAIGAVIAAIYLTPPTPLPMPQPVTVYIPTCEDAEATQGFACINFEAEQGYVISDNGTSVEPLTFTPLHTPRGWAITLPPCATEDASQQNCIWLADQQGNHGGTSYIDIAGIGFPIPPQ